MHKSAQKSTHNFKIGYLFITWVKCTGAWGQMVKINRSFSCIFTQNQKHKDTQTYLQYLLFVKPAIRFRQAKLFGCLRFLLLIHQKTQYCCASSTVLCTISLHKNQMFFMFQIYLWLNSVPR